MLFYPDKMRQKSLSPYRTPANTVCHLVAVTWALEHLNCTTVFMFYYISNACFWHTWHPLGTESSSRLPEEYQQAFTGQRPSLHWHTDLPGPSPAHTPGHLTPDQLQLQSWPETAPRSSRLLRRLFITTDFRTVTRTLLLFSRLKNPTTLVIPYQEIIRPVTRAALHKTNTQKSQHSINIKY